MANRGTKRKNMNSLVEQFCSVTGASKEVGEQLLNVCNGDLELAIGMHMDDAPPVPGASSMGDPSNQQQSTENVEEEVRAPIPQKTEQLVDVEQYSFRGRRRAARSVFDGFRDFQAETRQAEERARLGAAVSVNKKRTLEDLFRPPIDILHKGSFHSAKEAGISANKWLLVNIQNVQEFSCQVLNRDVWSQPPVKGLVRQHFIFWQVYSDSEDGKHFMQFYKVPTWPYIAVIDPQTGEKFMEWNKMTTATFSELVTTFLSDHPKPDMSSTSPPSKKRKESIVDATEDSQMEAAIAASIREDRTSSALTISSDSDQSEDSNLETFTDSDSDTETKPKKKDYSKMSKNKRRDDSLKIDDSSRSSTEHIIADGKQRLNRVVEDNSTKDSNDKDLLSLPSISSNSSSHSSIIPEERNGSNTLTSDLVSQDSSESVATKWQDYLGDKNDEDTKLLIRFPDGKREPLSIPHSSQLRAVIHYVSENLELEEYELVTNFPRRNLSSMDSKQTLKQSGLHPQETIFIQKKS